MKRRVVLIHGAWLSAQSWETFEGFFKEKGHEVVVPEWPRKSGDVAELRKTAGNLAGLGIEEIADHLDGLMFARSMRRRSSLGTSSAGCSRRSCSTTAWAPLLRRDRSCAARRGSLNLPATPAESGSSGARAPVQAEGRRHAHAAAVHLRLRQHVHPRGCEGSV